VETVRVLAEFAPHEVEAISQLAHDVETLTGVAPLSDDAWTGIHAAEPGRDRGLLVPASGADPRADAYAHLAHHHEGEWGLELVARPGTADVRPTLVAAALDVVAAEGGGHVSWWIHGVTPGDVALAARAGFEPERELHQMRVGLPLPDPPRWPEGVSVRTFEPGRDEADWVAVNNRAFAGHVEQGNWTVDDLLRREAEPWFAPEGFLLAFDADGLAGFCWTKVHPPQPPAEPVARGEIYVIGADPLRHGKGLGRALTSGGLASLAERGITVGMLFVDAANPAAAGLYDSLGFEVSRVDRAFGRVVAPTEP
jgi:mycothiol synthase